MQNNTERIKELEAEVSELRRQLEEAKRVETALVGTLNDGAEELAAAEARCKELEAALSGRTISCVCGAEARYQEAHTKWAAELDRADKLEARERKLRDALEKIAARKDEPEHDCGFAGCPSRSEGIECVHQEAQAALAADETWE